MVYYKLDMVARGLPIFSFMLQCRIPEILEKMSHLIVEESSNTQRFHMFVAFLSVKPKHVDPIG